MDDYVGIADNDGLDLSHGQFTEALWVYPDASGGDNAVLIGSDTYDDTPARYPFIRIVNHTRLEVGFGNGSSLNSFTTGDVLTENAWNHVVATFDGTLYKIYVNGTKVAGDNRFAGETPAPTRRFDLGRGTIVTGTPTCGTLKLKWFEPLPKWSQRFRVKVNGNVVFSTGLYPNLNKLVPLKQTIDFCGSAQISVERGYYSILLGQQWQSMGSQTIDTTPGFFSRTFSDGWSDALVSWRVIYDATDTAYFKGKLDDVRLYTRALSDLEVADLYRSGWHNATLAEAGAPTTTWSDTVPVGLEGAYQLALRGADTAEQFDVSADTQQAWRGMADTLAPRLSITREPQGNRYHYTVTAQDFNLTEDGFVSPCGIGVVTDRQYYRSPWYQTLSGQTVGSTQKLFQLTAECDVAIDTPFPLQETGAYDTLGLARQVAVDGNIAYIADGARGLQIIDVSDPAAPQLLAVFDTPPTSFPPDTRGVTLHNGDAYLTDYRHGLLIVDVNNPASPQLRGSLSLPSCDTGSVVFSGNTAFCIDSVDAYLYSININNPAYPDVLDGQPFGRFDDIALSGNYVYLADSNLGQIQVVDVALPQILTPVGAPLNVPGNPQSVAVASNYLYSAAGAAGLLVFDISIPTTPTLVARLDTSGYARDVTIIGDTAYVADGPNGLKVVDVSDPLHPMLVNGGDTPGGAHGVDADANYGYVADYRQGLRIISLAGITGTTTACDSIGNCAHVGAGTLRESVAVQATTATSPTFGITILNMPAVLETVNPVTIIGEAHATTDSLRALTVTVDSSLIYTDSWAVDTITETTWSANWSLLGLGAHRIQANLLAWDGNTATDVVTVTVDVTSPVAVITPTVLTQSHYHEATNTVDFTGLVTDDGGVERVQLSILNNPAVDIEAGISGNDWLAAWYLGAASPPDGETYTVTARAIDIAGRSNRITESVTIDVVSPSPITPTLSAGGSPVAPGETLRNASPALTLSWTAATDGSGLADYLVNWQVADSTGITDTALQIAPTAPRTTTFNPPEATKVTAGTSATDIYGHTNWQRVRPVYVDTPLTPDYVPLIDPDGVYLGWMDSGCSSIGVDRRVSRSAPAGASLSAEQRLFATWDTVALRLAWEGANWGSDGELFIYLDTQTGGSTTAFNPHPENTTVTLPDAMAADYLIWVRDAETASLLSWDGTQWDFDTALTAEAGQYGFAAGHTDLHIPFNLLGITDPATTALSLVAFSTAEDSLQLWAAMPNANPIGRGNITLTHNYHWDTLGAGVCPNGSDGSSTKYLDSELEFSFKVQPVSTTVMGNGQTVSYTIGYQNYGTMTATNVLADIFAADALRLSGGVTHQTLALGDIAPGASGSTTFTGIIDAAAAQSEYDTCTATQPDYTCSHLLTQASVSVQTYDTAHPQTGAPIASWDNTHPVDVSPPEFVGITTPEYLLTAGQNSLSGYAFDDSGVSSVTLRVQPSGGGAPSLLACPNRHPGDGQWTCDWDLSGTHNGDTFGVQLRATDTFGHTGNWVDWGTLMVDTQAPTISLNQNTVQAISNTILTPRTLPAFAGSITDNGGIAGMEACLDGNCTAINPQLDVPTFKAYEDVPSLPIALDNNIVCGSSAVVRTFTVPDNITIGQIAFGFNANYTRRNDLQAILQSPAGTQVRLLYHDGSDSILQNYNVTLLDSVGERYSDGNGDDTAAPYFARVARPDQPLSQFRGENAAGTWTLSLCSLNTAPATGNYQRSRLTIYRGADIT